MYRVLRHDLSRDVFILSLSTTLTRISCDKSRNGRNTSGPYENRKANHNMTNIEDTQSSDGDLVVIGASAGGVEALSTLVGTLPSDFPAPVILAQHLDPNRPSTLDHILQRRTSLPVTVVTSNSSLEAGHIYVVPSNHYILVKNHHVEVQSDHAKRPLPSIDALLSSAAEVYGDRLIAVVLTGSGSDGAAGSVDVKNAGGTVIVQNPRTARYPSMQWLYLLLS